VETGRRRRWSEDEKLKIVLESSQAPRRVAAMARGNDLMQRRLAENDRFSDNGATLS
jgi:transposase-like protein